MRVAMAQAAPLRVRPAGGAVPRGALATVPLRGAAPRRCVVAAPRPRAVLRLRPVAVASAGATPPAAFSAQPEPSAAEPPHALLPRLAAAARAALAAVAARRAAAAQRAGPLAIAAGLYAPLSHASPNPLFVRPLTHALARSTSFDALAMDAQILWNKALLLDLKGRVLLFLAISVVVTVRRVCA
jgi:hypothetical protein